MLKRLLLAVLLLCSFACEAAVYALPWGPKPQFVDANGAPMSNGSLKTYQATTTTLQATYTDSTGGVANPTTITLNTRGETPNEVWLSAGQSYKFVLLDSSGSTVWTVDNVSGVNDVTAQLGNEWVTSGLTPTFVSGTSFTVTGDQTQVLTVGRRLKTTNSGGTIYSTVTASAFAAVTTVTVANDSGNLDAGLSAVSYGLLNPVNPSAGPAIVYRKGAAVASATTTDVWGIVGDYVHVTGVTTITSLGTAPYAGAQRTIIFDGVLTLTHNGTTLKLPGAANITTAADDRAVVRADTTANMVVVDYIKASGKAVINTANTQPTRQVFTSGSGTYTTPGGATRINVRLVGAGGGGGAQATNAGATGGNTTFSTLTGSGGVGGSAAGTGGSGGAGGAAAGGDFNIPGGTGQAGESANVAGVHPQGGMGAGGPWGGAGGGGVDAGGANASANSGAGGGGGGGSPGTSSGAGGGAGGYVEKLITSPAATYSYGVGAAGAGGAAGAAAGGNGAAGIVVVDEFYNYRNAVPEQIFIDRIGMGRAANDETYRQVAGQRW